MRKLIYHPSRKAGEYADKGYAVNLFSGCTHGCRYCYVPGVCHTTREAFHGHCDPAPDVLERLKADMERVGVLPEPIFLCFTTDPYCIDAPAGITRQAIEIILGSGNRVNILTKGWGALKDFDILSSVPGNKFGVTLTFYSLIKSEEWEPKASYPVERLSQLALAKGKGIYTWASIEPVIDPEESLMIMEATIPYVDEYKIGKWNYDARANDLDMNYFKIKARDMMERYGKKFMFKKDLL